MLTPKSLANGDETDFASDCTHIDPVIPTGDVFGWYKKAYVGSRIRWTGGGGCASPSPLESLAAGKFTGLGHCSRATGI